MLSHAGRRPKLTLYVSVLASISVFSVVSFSVFRCGSLPRLRSTPVQALSEAPLLRVVSPQLHDIDASIPRHSTNSISTSSSAFTLNTSTPADKITTTVDGTGTRTAVDERSAPYTVEKGTRTAVDERSAPIVDSETKMISVRVNEDRRSVNRPAITDAKTTSKNMVRSNLTLPNIYTLQKTVAGRGTPTTTTVSKHKPTASQITGNTRDLFIGVPESCKEPNCMEFLSHTEKSIVKNCGAKVSRSMPANMVHKATCKFLQDNGRQPVALNSQEGSGNTWVRALLEGVTGICTGFNWECDAVLRAHGFLGEGIKSGKVLVVKTHVRRPKWMGEFSWHVQMISYEPSYQSAILILRHPALAMIADYNRQKSLGKDSHTHIVSPTVFGELHVQCMPQCKHACFTLFCKLRILYNIL